MNAPRLSNPTRFVALVLLLGVAPVTVYLVLVRAPQRSEYFLREHLRDLEVLSLQTTGEIQARLEALERATRQGSFAHLEQPLPRGSDDAVSKDWSRACAVIDKKRCKRCCAVCVLPQSAQLELPKNTERYHDFSGEEPERSVKRTTDLYFISSCKVGTGYVSAARFDKLVTRYLGDSKLADYEIFVTDSSGEILFEHGPPGLRLLNLPQAEQGAQKPDAAGSARTGAAKEGDGSKGRDGLPSVERLRDATTIQEVRYAGETFQLLTHPMRVVQHVDINGSDEPRSTTWVFAALIPEADLRRRAFGLSYGSLSALPLFIVIALLSVPMLKAGSIGPRQASGRADLRLLGFSLLLVPNLVVTAAVSIAAHRSLESTLDADLKQVSEQLRANFEREVNQASSALEAFIGNRARTGAEALQKGQGCCDDKCGRLVEDLRARSNRKGFPKGDDSQTAAVLKQVGGLTDSYPYFAFVFWTDKSGMQCEKWSLEKHATPRIQIKDVHPFFDQLVSLRTDVTLHTQTSPLTGQPITVLSKPIPPTTNSRQEDNQALGIAAMVMSPLSLLKPVLPPGFSFAVIEDDGKVIYHPIGRRSLYENFFQETDHPRDLRSLVVAQRAGDVETHYHGRTFRMYLQPLGPMPWTLIVYRDKEMPRTVNLDVLLAWLSVIAFSLAVWAIVVGLARLILGRNDALWLWPDSRLAFVYGELAVVLACWGLLLAGICWHGDNGDSLDLAAALGSAPLILSYVFLKVTRLRQCRRWLAALMFASAAAAMASVFLFQMTGVLRVTGAFLVALTVISCVWRGWIEDPYPTFPWERCYVLVGCLTVLTASVLPSLIAYRDAYTVGMETFVRHGQLKLAHRLAERRERVRNKYERLLDGWTYRDMPLIEYRLKTRLPGGTDPQLDIAPGSLLWDGDDSASAQEIRPQPQSGAQLLWPKGWLGCGLFSEANGAAWHFTSPVMAYLRVYHSESVQLRQLVYGGSSCSATGPGKSAAGDRRWWSTVDKKRHSTVVLRDQRFAPQPYGVRELAIRTDAAIPNSWLPPGPWVWAAVMAAAFGLGGLFTLLSWFANRLFDLYGQRPSESKAAVAPEAFSSIWAKLTDEQQSVLYRLATTGSVTPHPQTWAGVRFLADEGLVRFNPEPIVATDVLRKLVAEAGSEAQLQSWEAAGPESAWNVIRRVTIASAIVVGIALYFTRRELLIQWSGALTAIAAVAGSVGTMLGLFRASQGRQPK